MSNGTVVEYAKVEGLKVKDRYQWKTILTRRRFLACKAKTPVFGPVRYDYDPSRSQEVPIRLLDDFAGYIQTDAYEGYSDYEEIRELYLTMEP